jgi:hypothetical protein
MNETVKPGKYYLGDPVFALDEKTYHEIYGDIFQYEDGKFDLKNNDQFMIVHKTHYGDGIFFDTKKRKYIIETGLIALIPISMIEKTMIINAKKHGVFFSFDNFVRFLYHRGLFTIRSNKKIIEIDTQNEDEYDSQEEGHLPEDSKYRSLLRQDEDESSLDGSCDDDSEEEINSSQKVKRSFFKKK